MMFSAGDDRIMLTTNNQRQ